MVSIDKDVWHGPLLGLGKECTLDGVAIGLLVKLLNSELNSLLGEKVLGLRAEWAPALGVDHDLVLGDLLGNLSLQIVSVDHLVLFCVCGSVIFFLLGDE